MPNVHFSFRRGAGDVPEILYGKVEIKPTLAFARGTSLVLPAPTTLDLVNGEATANNVYPTPAPVAGQVEWAYRVKAIDTRGQSFEWMVGVPDSTGTVEFTSLPRYFETKPPLFGEGPQGVPGEAAKITVGTVAGGATASVTNSGTNQNAVLDFVLPKGDKGDKGDGVPAGGAALQYIRKDASGAVTEWATLDKTAVGLSNVDNTSDINKPVSTAQKAYIDQSNTLPYKARNINSSPTEYPEGVTVFVGTSAEGWPGAPGGVEDSVRVVTYRAPGDQNAIQYLSARLPSSGLGLSDNSILYRTSNTVGVWGDFQELGNGSGTELITPEMFGAVGDGVNDDAAAISSAINYAYENRSSGRKTVTFLPGSVYNTYARVRLRGEVDYVAHGATFKKNSRGGGYAVFYTGSDGAKGYGSGDSNFTWKGGTFRGEFATGNMICPFALHHTDNAVFSDFKCFEVQGTGHTFDMLGCSNIKIHDFEMHGFHNSSTGGYQKSECIQIDCSIAGSSSAPDSAGSYDGLITRDVEVYNGLFTSITSGGVFYGAPNPIGSHTQVETQVPTNIRFHHNRIVNPTKDTTSGIYGAIHFIGGQGIYIEDNTWEYTAASPNFSTTLIGLYSTNWGTAWNGANFESGASNTSQALANRLAVRDVRVARNTVLGIKADSSRHLIVVENKTDSTAAVQAERVTLDANECVCDSGTSPLNFYQISNVTGLTFDGVNSCRGPVRAVQCSDCTGITVQNFEIVGTRSDAVRFDNFKRLRILSMSSVQSAGTSLYLNGGTDLEVGGAILESLSSSRAVAVNACNIFTISNIKSKSPSGVVAVQVYSASTNGFIANTIAYGGATVAVQNGSTSTTVTNERVVAL